MLGRLAPQSTPTKDATIVGAGISGLLSAYYLDRAGYRVTLIEGSDRAGGLIATAHSELGLSESAAHSFPATPVLRELCAELGVELTPLRRQARARYIYRRGRLRRFPLTIAETIRAFFRAYFVLAQKRDPETLSLEDWARRFLGEAPLRYLITPFTRGIFGTEPSDINVSAAFPVLCVPRGHSLLSYLLAKKWRAHLFKVTALPTAVRREVRKLPKGEISAPKDGMQALTDALAARLKQSLGTRFQLDRKIESLDELSGVGNLILCVPAQEAARLLKSERRLAAMLEQVRYSPLTTATVFVSKDTFVRAPEGLGVLIPKEEGRRALGVLFNSSAFAGRVSRPDLVSLTMMFEQVDEGESDPVVRDELAFLFGVKAAPLRILRRSWARAVPKYDEHLLQTWRVAEESWCSQPGRILFGNYTGQVSIRGMAELAAQLH